MPRGLAIAVFVLAAGPVAGAPPSAEEIQAWVKDLDSPSFKTRDLAARNLRQAGPDAAAALAKAARTGTVETADRALRLLGEMAEGPDAKAEAAARRHLRRLAEGNSPAANDARAILHRKRNRILAQILFAGAAYDEHRGTVTRIDLDDARDLTTIMPLLKEFPELESLSISNRAFTDGEARHLADLPNLRDLNLFQSNIGDEGLKHLTGLKNLRWLPMGKTRVTNKGLQVISGMTQLEYVGVRGNDVTDDGLVHLKGLTNLTGLFLGETKVTDAGLKHLTPLTRLRELVLLDLPITDDGLEQLKGFKDLRDVYLHKTRTTEDGRARLKEAIPDVTIHTDPGR